MEELKFFFADPPYPPFFVELAGISYCTGSYYIEREASTETVFEYVVSGEGTIISDGVRHTAVEGDVYILHQGSNHAYYSDDRNPWVKIFINAKGALPENILAAYGLENTVVISGFKREHLFRELYSICCSDQSQEIVFDRCALKFHEIVASIHAEHIRSADIPEEVRRLRSILDDHIFERISIDELAASIYRSPDYITKLFRRVYHQTPYAYLLRQKMQTAANLLQNTQLPSYTISAKLGFEDPHHFSKLFKKQHGVSPRQYRNSLRSDKP